jgi:hypothetical protein
MFIQVITAPCTAHDELRSVLDSWETDLAPTAEGWLGGTYGFTDDDQFVAVVRFDSREHAMANSDRPEQGAWAERFTAALSGAPEFRDHDEVLEFLDGGSDDAGFVQVIQGRADDLDALRQLVGTADLLREARPEVIGGTLAISGDGSFTQTIAFTDEASARIGEKQEPPPEVRELLGKVMGEARFLDLHSPWFASP